MVAEFSNIFTCYNIRRRQILKGKNRAAKHSVNTARTQHQQKQDIMTLWIKVNQNQIIKAGQVFLQEKAPSVNTMVADRTVPGK